MGGHQLPSGSRPAPPQHQEQLGVGRLWDEMRGRIWVWDANLSNWRIHICLGTHTHRHTGSEESVTAPSRWGGVLGHWIQVWLDGYPDKLAWQISLMPGATQERQCGREWGRKWLTKIRPLWSDLCLNARSLPYSFCDFYCIIKPLLDAVFSSPNWEK